MCVRNYGANVSYILGTNLLFTRSNLWITLSTLGSNGVEQDSERGCVTVMEEMCGDVSKEECGFVDEKICSINFRPLALYLGTKIVQTRFFPD